MNQVTKYIKYGGLTLDFQFYFVILILQSGFTYFSLAQIL